VCLGVCMKCTRCRGRGCAPTAARPGPASHPPVPLPPPLKNKKRQVLVEGPSRRDPGALTGRTDTFRRAVFHAQPVPASYTAALASSAGQASTASSFPPGDAAQQPQQPQPLVSLQRGDYVAVQIASATGGTLQARALARTSVREFVGVHGSAAPGHSLAVMGR
jgi:hypothetical protein